MRIFCTLLILSGIALLQFPDKESLRDNRTFSNWVIQHLTTGESEAASTPERASKAEFLTFLQELMSGSENTAVSDDDPESRKKPGPDSIIPYLYVAWEQHQDATGMAGTFSSDRVQLLSLLKHYAGPASPDSLLISLRDTTHGKQISGLLFGNVDFISYTRIAVLNGISINAP